MISALILLSWSMLIMLVPALAAKSKDVVGVTSFNKRWTTNVGKRALVSLNTSNSFSSNISSEFVVSHDDDACLLLVIVLILILSAADTALLDVLLCSSTSFFDSSHSTTPMEEIIGSWRIRILNSSSLVVPSLMQMFGPQAVVTLFHWQILTMMELRHTDAPHQ